MSGLRSSDHCLSEIAIFLASIVGKTNEQGFLAPVVCSNGMVHPCHYDLCLLLWKLGWILLQKYYPPRLLHCQCNSLLDCSLPLSVVSLCLCHACQLYFLRTPCYCSVRMSDYTVLFEHSLRSNQFWHDQLGRSQSSAHLSGYCFSVDHLELSPDFQSWLWSL